MLHHLINFRNKKFRAILLQTAVLLAVFFTFFFLYQNLQGNLIKKNIATGFSFLEREAGFEISESLPGYNSSHNYGRALWVGLLNTLKVSLLGNLLAAILGIFIGIFALAKNKMLKGMAKSYIEIIRNIPLILQLFFWYALFTDIFPGVRQSLNPIQGVFLSNRGLFFPSLEFNGSIIYVAASFFLCIPLFFVLRFFGQKIKDKTGEPFPYLKIALGLFIMLPTLVFFLTGVKFKFILPVLTGFNFEGGYSLSPEFCSLLLGLSIYTSAFMAEIVRSGILSIPRGQEEAALSLGLSKFQAMLMVILPQAMRTIIPPLTNQFLNLTKNSSLAVAIAYPDFVSIANTTMNQTGQAVELIILIIAVYLSFSLITSVFMNWFNKKMALVER
jgi:general L-amino acid transport system permease protein